jgi:transmembrane sensor
VTNIVSFTPKKSRSDEVRQQACCWLARLDAGATEADLEALKQWLRESPVHVEAFFAMASAWDQLSVLSELADMFPLEQYSPSTAHTRGLVPKVAAMLVLGILSLFWWQGDLSSSSQQAAVSSAVREIHETLVGEQTTVPLQDGSQLILNTDTRLMVVYTDQARNIFLLRGEAYFSVAKDFDRPFRVYAGKKVVEATGTAFTVQRRQGDILEVLVEQGSVQLSKVELDDHELDEASLQHLPANSPPVATLMSLQAGETVAAMMQADGEVEKKKVQPDEMEIKLSWRHGMLLFQGDALEKVLEEVSRYTTIRLEADEAIKAIKVQGYFRAGDINGLLFAMRENFHINAVEVDEGHIVLSQSF